jgi:hypothetical protein
MNKFLLCYLRQKIGPAELSLIGYCAEAILFHATVYRLFPPCWYIPEETARGGKETAHV